MKISCNIIMAACAVALVTGCGKTEKTADVPDAVTPPELSAVFTSVARPAEVVPIPQLRGSVKPGDEVVIEAKVMGADDPFVAKRAVFIVGDEATITSCDLLGEDDHCETPWDACCEDSGNLRAGTATIQVVDADGAVLRHGIRGVNGLVELSRVRVTGTVAEQSNGEVFIINATGIEVL